MPSLRRTYGPIGEGFLQAWDMILRQAACPGEVADGAQDLADFGEEARGGDGHFSEVYKVNSSSSTPPKIVAT